VSYSRAMATKRRATGGRVTPKGGASSRITPKGTQPGTQPGAPTHMKAPGPSPLWVPVLMGILLGIGVIVIFCNYVGWVPGGTDNAYLGVGLVFILGGIITATKWR
jgi:Cell division protein CrgA